jgi:hypothetical protein
MHSTCARVRLDRSHATGRISPSDPKPTFRCEGLRQPCGDPLMLGGVGTPGAREGKDQREPDPMGRGVAPERPSPKRRQERN